MSSPEDAADTPSPLVRFTSGGWVKGIARMAVGMAIAGVAIHYFAEDAWRKLLEPSVLPFMALGAAVHALQRTARIVKWKHLIATARLVDRTVLYLVRVQFIGMLGNLLLPVSEALKIWAVSKTKQDAIVATESIAVDTAMHAACVGAIGGAGLALSGVRHPYAVGAAAALVVVSVALIGGLRLWKRERPRAFALWAPKVHAGNLVETLCQLAIYALGAAAVGVDVGLVSLIAIAPVLFLSDLFVLTPSGLGVREALFAVAFGALTERPAELGVAMGLSISGMLLAAALLGGLVAMLAPQRDPR